MKTRIDFRFDPIKDRRNNNCPIVAMLPASEPTLAASATTVIAAPILRRPPKTACSPDGQLPYQLKSNCVAITSEFVVNHSG